MTEFNQNNTIFNQFNHNAADVEAYQKKTDLEPLKLDVGNTIPPLKTYQDYQGLVESDQTPTTAELDLAGISQQTIQEQLAIFMAAMEGMDDKEIEQYLKSIREQLNELKDQCKQLMQDLRRLGRGRDKETQALLDTQIDRVHQLRNDLKILDKEGLSKAADLRIHQFIEVKTTFTIDDDYIADNSSAGENRFILEGPDTIENWFEDDDEVVNEHGEVVKNVNGDTNPDGTPRLTAEDYWEAERLNPEERATVFINVDADFQVVSYDEESDVAICLLKDKDGKITELEIRNYSKMNIVLMHENNVTEAEVNEMMDLLPDIVLRSLRIGDDYYNLEERKKMTMEPTERLKFIPGYHELTNKENFSYLFENFMDGGGTELNKGQYRERYMEIINELFLFLDNKNPEKDLTALWEKIFAKMDGLAHADKQNILASIVIGLFKHSPETIGSLLRGNSISLVEEFFRAEPQSVRDMAMILLLEYNVAPMAVGIYGGHEALDKLLVASVGGPATSDWSWDSHTIEALNHYKELLETLGLPTNIEADMAIQRIENYLSGTTNYNQPSA